MRCISVIVLHAFVTQMHAKEVAVHARVDNQNTMDKLADKLVDKLVHQVNDSIDKLADKLFDRTLKARAHDEADLENATLGKPGRLGISQRTLPQLSLHAPSSVLPRCNWMMVTPSKSLGHSTESMDPIEAVRRAKNLHSPLGFTSIPSHASPPHAVAERDMESALAELSPEEKEHFAALQDDVDAELLEASPSDFFELLGLDYSANASDVKRAYRRLQKLSHPDIAGHAATPLAAMLNMAYNTLLDDDRRQVYAIDVKSMKNQQGGVFDGTPVSKWAGHHHEVRAVFVDESTCIGCKSCALWAPQTFSMETKYGRARCTTQWADDEDLIMTAVQTCPVECIYFVHRSELALLEFAMKGCKREEVHIMQMGSANRGNQESPFNRANKMLHFRKEARSAQNARGSANNKASGHNEALGGAIAAAWLELPADVKNNGWPEWTIKKNSDSMSEDEEAEDEKDDKFTEYSKRDWKSLHNKWFEQVKGEGTISPF